MPLPPVLPQLDARSKRPTPFLGFVVFPSLCGLNFIIGVDFFGSFLIIRFYPTTSICSIPRRSLRRGGTSSSVSFNLPIPSSW
ncbi:hypothetical protein B296_00056828 [Ensete ventricosum]|uniref:Uncharacterized protein n=1 Tax=Ensete ventricosum TaxID=4639 RepID=A0A426XTM1_ENSVE|nr:hypothetical protein B296_00056828 [Ensete ventricosum]